MTVRHISLTATLALAACLAASTTSLAASNFPGLVPLPDAWQPEGITAGKGNTVFVGSLANGAIWKGDVRTGLGDEFVVGEGATAAGVDYEMRADRLWVAGGPSGEVRVYDGTSGELLETYPFAGAGFLNDLVVTRDAVYVTDSFATHLDIIPLGAGGSLPDPTETFSLPMTGTFSFVPGQFNGNGIVHARGWLLVVMSTSGELLRVDPNSGAATVVDLGGATVASGDGLELRGSTLYVVRNFLNQVAVFQLGAGLASAYQIGTLTSPNLDIPTTAAWQAGRLWAVNARFTTPPTSTTEYSIVRLPAQRSAAVN